MKGMGSESIGLDDPILEVLGVGVALPVDDEPGVPDDVQVVADAPTELCGLLVFELKVELPADPAQRIYNGNYIYF
jgi:hypothetical protein